MARRRMIASVDTSDRLANVVMASLGVALLALLGLVAWLDGEDRTPDTAAADGVERVPEADQVNETSEFAPATEGDAAAPRGRPDGTDSDGAVGGGIVGGDGVAEDQDTPDRDAPPPAQRATPTPDVRVTPSAPPPDDGPVAGASDRQTPGVAPVAPAAPGETDRGAPAAPGETDRVPATVVSNEPLDIHTVFADLDADGSDERITAFLLRNWVRVQVERSGTQEWQVVARANGTVADDLITLRAEDLTGDGRPEVHTKQRVGRNGESVTLWSFARDDLQPMTASGGCWAGSNTFGIIGALVEAGQVTAICDESPQLPQLWPTAVYRWADGRWTFDGRTGVHRG